MQTYMTLSIWTIHQRRMQIPRCQLCTQSPSSSWFTGHISRNSESCRFLQPCHVISSTWSFTLGSCLGNSPSRKVTLCGRPSFAYKPQLTAQHNCTVKHNRDENTPNPPANYSKKWVPWSPSTASRLPLHPIFLVYHIAKHTSTIPTTKGDSLTLVVY